MDERDDPKDVSRIPTVKDLVSLCRHLNQQKAKYIVIGGFAVIHHGYVRGTADIDLLISKEKENIERIKQALTYLEDKAAQEIQPEDLMHYTVVRVADEIVVDLMAQACGLSFEDLRRETDPSEIDGVLIPYLSAEGLLRTKMGVRPKDVEDRNFLERLIKTKKS